MKKLANTVKTIGFVGNSEKVSARTVITEAARLIAETGRIIHCDAETAKLTNLKCSVQRDPAALAKKVDLIMVFGGDGTMLRLASEVAGSPTPILGINIGGLGFLTAVSSQEMPLALQRVWQGDFTLETRPLIEMNTRHQGKLITRDALNDFVISRGMDPRLIILEVSVNGETLTHYRCDGLIVSSPTGSTAYSLSAGGAVVHPHAEVFELTPICPHTLSNRSVIVSLDSRIEVKVANSKPETILSADGQIVSKLVADDVVTIQRSKNSIRLMHLAGSSFFDTLRRKLHWSGANV